MQKFWIATCLVVLLLACHPGAADVEKKAEAAKSKAEILEQKATPDGNDSTPSYFQIISKPEIQAVDPEGQEPIEDAVTCLSRNIYWEAKGEGPGGMKAIANVVMNRLGHEGFPNTICEVVKQGGERSVCQFSWWCDGRPDSIAEEESYSIAKELARKALNQQLPDRTGGALYYHNRNVTPAWSSEYTMTAKIGEHLFYKPDSDRAK
jgi:spore germination cell wall hydrolase CwlJ-like protein